MPTDPDHFGLGFSSSPSSTTHSSQDADNRCAFIREDGSRCRSYRVRKVPNSQGYCAAHLGITGIQRSPRAYGRVGGFASHEARRRRKLLATDSWRELEPSGGNEHRVTNALRKVVEDRLANPKPGDDPGLPMQLRLVLHNLTSRQRSGPPADDVYRIHVAAVQTAERKRTEEEAWITRVGGGDYERGLEIADRHHREAEERQRKKEAEVQRQCEIAEAEEKMRQRDRRLARAIRRGESTADL